MKKLGIALSVLAALGSAALGHVYFQRLEAEVSGGPKVPVLVAARDIPVGGALSESILAVRDVPLAYVEGRHVRASELKKVLGARLASGLRANEAVLWNDLSKYSDHTRVLSGLIKQGLRAVAIDSRTADFEGLLRPGDRVDVLFTTGGPGSGGRTRTLLQNLLVLSVGGNIQRADEEGETSSARWGAVTLSASIEQAQKLVHAQGQGRLTLTLRSHDDITIVDGVPETTTTSLVAESTPTDRPAAAPSKRGIEHVR